VKVGKKTPLAAHGEVAERRRQRRHPVYQKPELLAEGPNQVWSRDITKLMEPVKWSYFYLYVILDIFKVTPQDAVVPILAALTSNTLSKVIMAVTSGGWAFAVRVVPGLVLVALAAWIGTFAALLWT